ncbi:MAG: DUF4347 domain-containing protein, partial [Aquabacterium sp.]|uniref:DUF4347 domain-containing protein n=1 Tax=Aquabacterium sp. TaxID=1872578 RepID=UPI0025BF992E
MLSKARSLLARLRSPRASRPEETCFDGRMEELEPRILFSADAAGAMLDPASLPAAQMEQAIQQVMPPLAADTRQTEASLAAVSAGKEVIFLDMTVGDAKTLLTDLLQQQSAGRPIDIVQIEADQDGVSVITDYLKAQNEPIDTIHVISHGDADGLQLGATRLDLITLTTRPGDISAWGEHLTDKADLLLYGCNLALGVEGRELVDQLGLLTGADVAASDDYTGAAVLAGDWVLEYTTGQVDSTTALTASAQSEWAHVLATTSFREGASSYAGTSDTWINSATPDTNNGAQGTIAITDNSSMQVLIKFDNIFGTGSGQIPYGSTITTATLTVYTTQDGTGNPAIYRVISNNWSESSTWNSLSGGISLDNVEASNTAASNVDVSTNNTTDIFTNLASTVQLWASGTANYGWVIVDDGNEWNFSSSENGTAANRPILNVTYTAPTPPSLDLDASGAGSNFSTTFTENGAAVKIADTDASVTAGSNTISTNLSAMTVTISNLFDGTAESLAATTAGTNITASYDSGTGVLSLTGSDTAANYQTVLRTVTYSNTDDTPTTTSRSITVVAADPYGGNSSTVTCTMAITAANDAPVITSNGGDATASISVAETVAAVTTVTSTDPEGTARTYSIVAGNDGAKFSIGAGTGVLTFVSAPDFETPTDSNADNVYVVTVQASDGSLTDTQTISVTVTDVGATLVVDTTSDSNDTGLGSSFTAEQLNATKGTDGKVSLREAIIAANTTTGTDTISFNIASGSAGTGADTGAYVITTSSGALPTIGEAITIDASTQSGYVAGGLHTVVLDGNDAAAYGLNLNNAADGSTIRGLVIRNFTSYGVYIQSGSDGNTIAGNFIGSFYADGSNKGAGSGNASTGIFSHGANTVIGGTTTADRNVISGNPAGYNIYLGTGSTGTTVKGNYVGLNAAGTAVFSTTNPDYGILVESTSSNITIGGTTAGSGNVVSGHTREGMWVTTSGTVTIQGNYIGTDVTGTVDLGNTRYGIYLDDTGSATIGGSSAGAGNLISGNDLGGIYASNASVSVQGNIIGLNAAGTAALANSGAGIEVRTSGVSTIGGNGSGYRNIISGNTGYGIQIETSPAGGHVIKGNYIGVGSDGTTLLGNGSAGIYINAYYATIGGKTSGDGNIIAGNGGAGIAVSGGHTNLFYRNSIYSNTGLGVDLGNDGVSVNDYNDGDGGANYLNNYPTITSVVTSGGTTTITGTIDWYQGPDTIYIELFSSDSQDASGYGEGKNYLGAAQVTTTSGTGDATFSLTVSGVSVGAWISAIANTETSFPGASEFSKAVQAVAPANAPRGRVIWNTNDRLYQYYADWSTAGFGEIGTNGLNLGDDISMIEAVEAPTRNEILFIGSADASGQILAAIWNGSTWSSVIAIPVASPSATASLYDSFAVAYDQISGDAMLIWDNGNTGTTGLSYATWNGTTWSSTSTISAPVSGEPVHMKLAANPIGHDMVLAVETTAASNNQYAIVWNGSSWGNSQTLGSNSSKQYFELNVAYEQQSSHAMVIYDASASNSANVQYRVWDGNTWGSEGSITAAAGVTSASELYNTAIASDPGSNRIAIAAKNAANETWLAVWDGSSWGSTQLATTSGLLIGDYHATMAVAFESQSGDLLAVYGKASGPNLYYRTWTNGGGWSAEGTGPSVGGTDVPYISKLYSDPYSNTIMLGVQDNASDLNLVAWDGSAWGTVTELDNATAHTYRENFTYVWYHNAPVVANLSGDTLAYTEDQSAQVIDQGTAATVTMGDEAAYDGGDLTVSLTAGSTGTEDVLGIRHQGSGAGQIGVSGANVSYGGTVIGTYSGGSGGNDLVITFNGSASNAAVTALVKNITYQNTNTSTPSTTTRTARFVVTNALGQSSINNDASITVTAVNDAPVNTVPGAQIVNEDASLVFSSGNSNLISIADVDASGGQMEITLSVDHGTVSLSGITSLTFSVGDGTADNTMTFTGTVSAINTALSGLTYSPSANYNGSDTLTITTSDQGNSGTGGAESDIDTIAITVTAINDNPVITSDGGGASAAVNVAENSTAVTTVTATDADAGSTLTYSISGGADSAKFSINSSTGVLTFASAPDFESPTDAGGNNVYDVIV